MTAEAFSDGPYRLAYRFLSRSPRLPLLTGVLGTVCAAAVAAFGAWPAVAAMAGFVGGAGLTLAGARRVAVAQHAELVRRGELLDRRAEQVAALSHELRTPLSMIKGAVDLLVEGAPGPLTADQRRFLTVVAQQCTHVINLCEGLLVQAKIEAGIFTLRPEPVDVSAVARDVVAAMRPLCAARRQRITLDTPQVTPCVSADPMLLTQALTNLLSNAGRFTSVGGGIDVRVTVIDTGIAVYVTDDGAGMTREQRRRMFQRFATGRPLADGTGLGLVITKTIVELHGGSILVDTTAMHGTTVLFTLPFARPE